MTIRTYPRCTPVHSAFLAEEKKKALETAAAAAAEKATVSRDEPEASPRVIEVAVLTAKASKSATPEASRRNVGKAATR